MHVTTKLGVPTREGLLKANIDELRRMQEDGRHADALQYASALLVQHPENRDLRLIEASALRNMGRTEESLASCAKLEAIAPHFSLMHQERGFCHVLRHDAPQATAALLKAVNINPSLTQSWRMLEAVYRIVGDVQNAAIAARQQAALKSLPPEVLRGISLFSDGELAQAEDLMGEFLRTHDNHPEALRLLAKIGFKRESYDVAERLLSEVLAIAPDHHAARFEYVETLICRDKYPEAKEAMAPLLDSKNPANHEFQSRARIQAATIAMCLGQYHEVLSLCRGLLAEQVGANADSALRADIFMLLADALRTLGERQEAIETYRAVVAIQPDHGYAYWGLANLKTYRFSDAEIAAMRQAFDDKATNAPDRMGLAFALGKAMEDWGDSASAWSYYTALRGRSHYQPERGEISATEQKCVCTPAFFAQRQGWGNPAHDPIFILGLTRGGSTLIEQILSSHPQVEGAGELPNIQRMVEEMQTGDPDPAHPPYPAALVDLTEAQVRVLGERYLAETRVYRETGRPFFIDKLPSNFRNVGFIHLILPNARIIDARRGPMACCVSNFKQLYVNGRGFATGHAFTYGLEDIGRHYRTYLDLMRHWDAVLPGKVIRIINEDLVADPEGEIRSLLDACGLPFDASCLSFHENRRAVRTPSAEQVRRPINSDGVDAWRAFETWLDPLKTALGDALDHWRE